MDDEEAIRNLIGEHFEALKCEPGTNPDWRRIREDFLYNALLFGAVRPVQARTVDGFIERMETVARKSLNSFEEHTRGMKIHQFGNVAVALAMSELLENKSEKNHDISAYLLVKSEGRWFIAAHAWDQASDEKPIPDELR